jgi:hypothetical protein
MQASSLNMVLGPVVYQGVGMIQPFGICFRMRWAVMIIVKQTRMGESIALSSGPILTL